MGDVPAHGGSRTGWRTAAALAMVVAVVAGCVPSGTPPDDPGPGPTSVARSFTVGTTDRITVTDPAAIVDAASATVAYNVFQRVMTTEPGQQAPKPDAGDCRFISPTLYGCELFEDLKFHNGHALTSSDIKFSIERALRLDIPGSSASTLSSLRRIETPDERTVHFVLSRPDSEFPQGLSSPAASIVDEEIYDPDAVRPPGESMSGSGPFQVSFFNEDQLQLAPSPLYRGRFPAGIDGLVVRHYADSAALETAMAEHEVDVVWRGLSTPAVSRLTNQITTGTNERTEAGFSLVTLPGSRVRQLWWNTDSKHRGNADMRKAVAAALQEYRVLDSLLPAGIPGRVSSFPVGPGAEVTIPWKQRIQLTLAYDPTAPDAADQASQIRSRLEDSGGLSVRLVRATPVQGAKADLQLIDFKAWTSTPMAWLQPYLDAPVKAKEVAGAAAVIRDQADPAKADPAKLDQALASLQRLAAADLVILPIIQTDESIFVAEGWIVSPELLAPGWQLALWGFRHA